MRSLGLLALSMEGSGAPGGHYNYNMSKGSGQGDLAMPVKPELLQLWSPGLASGDWVRGNWERGGEGLGRPREAGVRYLLSPCFPPQSLPR